MGFYDNPTGMMLRKLVSGWAVIGATALFANAGSAQTPPENGRNAETIDAILTCRQISDDKARLACFDRNSGQLATSLQQGHTVVVDRAAAIEDQRQRFGQTRRDPDEKVTPLADESLDELTGSVVSATRDRDGRWIIELADGARWRQIDSTLLGRPPEAGSTITIKRAALGSFKISIENGPAFKARRIG